MIKWKSIALPGEIIERASVPCKGCTACCHKDRIVLLPEQGDVIESYETVPAPMDKVSAVYGSGRRMLAQKPNGDCIYLGETGCMIWDRIPTICRMFDCRKWYLKFSRQERKRLLAQGVLKRDVIEAGRKRVHTLDPIKESRFGGG